MQAFVYTELQISTPFATAPWREINQGLRAIPGLKNKTWLAGVEGDSLGGFYVFDELSQAKDFVNDVFPTEAAKFNVAQTTRIFDAPAVAEASRDMNSVHFGAELKQRPGAFVYTEVQLSLPFDQVPWRVMNPILKRQPGLMAKTWLSGIHTQTPGGLYAFDTMENARRFVIVYFPTEANQLQAAFTTRLFDASVVAEASREMDSPFFRY